MITMLKQNNHRSRYRAVQFNPLAETPLIRVLVSLTLALQQPSDRLAWLCVLRAPFAGLDLADAERLAVIGERVRNLKQHGFEEGVSTRLLIYAGNLMTADIDPRRAAEVAIITAISDDPTVQQAVADIVDVILP